MARVTYGALVTELAGSIGGITFQKNSSGNIARLRSKKPLNPTQEQSNNQVAITQLVAYWSTISQANKDTWNVLAAAHNHFTPWSEEKTLNGFQWFLSCNRNMYILGLSPYPTAPAYVSVDPGPAFTISLSATYIKLVFDSPVTLTTENIIIYATPPIRHSSIKLRRPLILLNILPVGVYSEVDLTSDYESAFNLTWADIYSSSVLNIILRNKLVKLASGLSGIFTSQIAQII